jgi:hypothetical protein
MISEARLSPCVDQNICWPERTGSPRNASGRNLIQINDPARTACAM